MIYNGKIVASYELTSGILVLHGLSPNSALMQRWICRRSNDDPCARPWDGADAEFVALDAGRAIGARRTTLAALRPAELGIGTSR